MREVNQAGLDLIKAAEGVRNTVYRDPVGIPTVGVGHVVLPDDNLEVGDTISDEQADQFLEQDLQTAASAVESLVTVDLTDNQFAALVSLVFNIGQGNFKGSTLLRLLNVGDMQGAANQFLKWNRSRGKVLPGLVTRRANERALFLS